MLKTSIKILEYIQPEFEGKDAAIFVAELLFDKVISQAEGQIINAMDLHSLKFVAVFCAMKSKPEDLVFPALQKICMKLGWRSVLKLIQSKLRLENMEELIVSNLNLQKVHKIFKHAIPTTQKLFVGRTEYLRDIHESIEKYYNGEQNNHSNLVKVAVTGLGGVGKTQLVIEFIRQHQLEYDSIIWINADSYEKTSRGFTNLGQKLGTFNKEMDVRTNVEAVYEKLGNLYSRNLIIFDNADDYIPNDFWFDTLDNFVLIITSRNREWQNFEIKADIDILKHDEALEFVKKSLSEENYDSDAEINTITKELQFFPLALQQAVAYIKQTHKEGKLVSARFTISDYLKEYGKERKTLLNYPISSGNNELTYTTTLNTWAVTVTKLKNLHYKKSLASDALPVKILNVAAYLDGERIDPTDFLRVAKDKTHLGWAFGKLEQYSLINKISIDDANQKTLCSVHKLVQEITMLRLLDEHTASDMFADVVSIMLPQFLTTTDEFEYDGKMVDVAAHFSSLIQIATTACDPTTDDTLISAAKAQQFKVRFIYNTRALEMSTTDSNVRDGLPVEKLLQELKMRFLVKWPGKNPMSINTGLQMRGMLPEMQLSRIFCHALGMPISGLEDGEKVDADDIGPQQRHDGAKFIDFFSRFTSLIQLTKIIRDKSHLSFHEITAHLHSVLRMYEMFMELYGDGEEYRDKYLPLMSSISEYFQTAEISSQLATADITEQGAKFIELVPDIFSFTQEIIKTLPPTIRIYIMHFLETNFEMAETAFLREAQANPKVLNEYVASYEKCYSANHSKVLRCLKYIAESCDSNGSSLEELEVLVKTTQHPNVRCCVNGLTEEPLD